MRKIWEKKDVVKIFLEGCDGEYAPFSNDTRKYIHGIYKFFDGYLGICKSLNKKPRYSKYYLVENKYLIKSRLEVETLIYLMFNNIDFKYESKVVEDQNFLYDFYIKDLNTYIECVGMSHQKSYRDKFNKKRKLYSDEQLRMVEIYPRHSIEKQYLELSYKIKTKKKYGDYLKFRRSIKVKILKGKYDDDYYFKKFKSIYYKGIRLKEIKEKYLNIYRYIICNYKTYENFLISKGYDCPHRMRKEFVDCFEEYNKISKKEGKKLNKTKIVKKHAWLMGHIQRKYGNFGNFCKKYRITPDSDKMRGISFRKDKRHSNNGKYKKLKKPWRVRLSIDGKVKTIGNYKTLDEATLHRDKILFADKS